MALRWLSDLIGTKQNQFSVFRALLDASGLTAARTFALPDAAGTLALTTAASESASGVAELATQAETDTGTDNARIVTPLKHATYVYTNRVVSSLGAAGTLGRMRSLNSDGKLYHDNGTTWDDLTGASGGASTSLANLASVAINTSLLPATAGAIDAGSATKPFQFLWFSGASGTPASNNFKLTGTATAARTITLPDASITVAGKDLAQTFTATQTFDAKVVFNKAVVDTPVTLTDASTIATDASTGSRFRVTLAGNRTLGAPTNPTDNQQCVWELIQDGTGTRTLALDTGTGGFIFGTDITSITLTTTASKTDFLTAIYNSTANRWRVMGFLKGY